MTDRIYTDDDFNITGDHVVRYTGNHDKTPPTWRVGEAWFRRVYDSEYRTTREYDAWTPEAEQKEEVKTVLRRIGFVRREAGRFIFRRHQHRAICKEDRDYVLVITQKTYGEPEWRILDAIRVSGRYLGDVLGFDERRKWTREGGNYREIGVPWTKVDPLDPVATYPPEVWETPDLSECYEWNDPEYPLLGEVDVEEKDGWKTLAEFIESA